jgi:DNA-binding transcriptional MocR family regulator
MTPTTTTDLQQRYDDFKARGLALDMTRGKPSAEQLDLAADLFGAVTARDVTAPDGTDTRNYGGLDGLPGMKAIFAEMLETAPAQVIVGGNSSLQMMHDTIVRALLHGVPDGAGPWRGERPVKFLCPSPGYDRHFAICEHFGVEMVVVDMTDEGPDVEAVARLVAADASIKGMWCVPKYSNPTGVTYSEAVVKQLAGMRTAAPDFRLMWDNAYAVHDLYAEGDPLANVLAACEAAGHPNRPLVFASTSKISLAGAGVAAMAASPANIADTKRHLAVQTIGPDKVNQLRHIRLFRNLAGIREHMSRHAALLRPKFEAVSRIFAAELGGKGVAAWTTPRGGYFVSLDAPDGCASAIVKLAGEAGVKLTGAGATYPYGKDPHDRNIRIAPSLPPLAQVELAMEVVAACVQLAAAGRRIN